MSGIHLEFFRLIRGKWKKWKRMKGFFSFPLLPLPFVRFRALAQG
jgi:hypothetical protein